MPEIPSFSTDAEPAPSPGRRDAVRSLAGLGAAAVALFGQATPAGASSTSGVSTPEDLNRSSVRTARKNRKKGRRGPRGRRGPAGPTPKITMVTESATVTSQTVQANCPPGAVVTGGGAGSSNTQCWLVSSGPVGNTTWAATVFCPGENTALLTVTVICAS